MIEAAIIIGLIFGAMLVLFMMVRSEEPLVMTLLRLLAQKQPSPERKDTGLVVGIIIAMAGILIAIQLFTAGLILNELRDIANAIRAL